MKVAGVLAVFAFACGSHPPAPTASAALKQTTAERMIALLPDGAQVIVELDLARLRGNAVVGDLVTRAVSAVATTQVPGLNVPVSLGCESRPDQAIATECALATSDLIVFAAYGVGTASASTIAVLATTRDIQGGIRVAPDLVALGPEQWTGQIATRAAIAAAQPLSVPERVLDLRARSFPTGATGAVVRVVAVLSFDARVAFARLTGFEAPAQVSLWGDVADDAAVVLDADATDPGTRRGSESGRRFAVALRKALTAIGQTPPVRALGVTSSIDQARFAVAGPWVRAVITIGPRHLARVVERARAMLTPSS